MKFKTAVLGSALALALPGMASALNFAEWQLNYQDAATELGATISNPTSNMLNEYSFLAEALVVFHDNDNSGTISVVDTFDDYIGFVIDVLNYNGNNNYDPEYSLGKVQMSGFMYASGRQVGVDDYVINSGAEIDFYLDFPLQNISGGTYANFGDLSTLGDGLHVQSGVGYGAGTNSGIIPDGALNVFFDLTDVLSTLDPTYEPLELISPDSTYSDLSAYQLYVDSNNNRCTDSGGSANCNATINDMLNFFGVTLGANDFVFHTRSDGSATKVPEPAILALMGAGLMGIGFARRRQPR